MSQRRDAEIMKFFEKNWRMPTHDEETILLRRVRPAKRTDLTEQEVRFMQLGRCSDDDIAAIAEVRRKADRNVYVPTAQTAEPGIRSVAYAPSSTSLSARLGRSRLSKSWKQLCAAAAGG